MSNYEMTNQQQYQGYHPSEPQDTYGQQYGQPSYYPQDIPANNSNQSNMPPMSQHQAPGENASYYSGASMTEPGTEEPNGEKGLGSTVVGGAAGGYAAHQMGGGKMGKVAGAALGAVGMNMATNALKPKPQPQPAVAAPVMAPAMTYGPVGSPYGMADTSMLGGNAWGIPSRRQGLLGRRAMRRSHMGLLY